MPKHGHGKAEAFGLGALSMGAVVSAVAGTWKFSEFLVKAKKLHEVASENGVFVRLLERVELDLAETERLLRHRDVRYALSRSADKLGWIRRTVKATRAAVREMEKHTIRVSGDLDGGHRVGLRHRLRWVLDEHEKLVHRSTELAMCHQGLLEVLGFLSGLEPLACCQPQGGYETRVVKETDFIIRDDDEEDDRKSRKSFSDEGYFDKEVETKRVTRTHHGDGKDKIERREVKREYNTTDGADIYRETRRYDEMDDRPRNQRWPPSQPPLSLTCALYQLSGLDIDWAPRP